MSLSVGVRGAHVTVGKNGVRKTVGLPGTGISYTDYEKYESNKKVAAKNNKAPKVQLLELPQGVSMAETPVPKKITQFEIAGFVLLVIGMFMPIILLPALAAIIWALVLMIKDNDFKCSWNMQSAISSYKRGDFNKCLERANKVLEYKDCNSARILIQEIEG